MNFFFNFPAKYFCNSDKFLKFAPLIDINLNYLCQQTTERLQNYLR